MRTNILRNSITYEIVGCILAAAVLAADNGAGDVHRLKPTPHQADKHQQSHNFNTKRPSPRFLSASAAKNLPLINSRVMGENKIPAITNDIFQNSPIYYFRMPVSAPLIYLTDFNEFANPVPPPAFAPYEVMTSAYPVHLPLPFLSNGKPSHIYKYPQNDLTQDKTTTRPKITATQKPLLNYVNLNKGPYHFNGKPADVYLLQDSFNSLFGNSMSNFYQ